MCQVKNLNKYFVNNTDCFSLRALAILHTFAIRPIGLLAHKITKARPLNKDELITRVTTLIHIILTHHALASTEPISINKLKTLTL